jgi:NodT family efflux transporter outer membrane factor (OMF) lipoprotein
MALFRTRALAPFAFRACAFAVALATGACSVGPDFQRPQAPAAAGYGDAAVPLNIPAATHEPGGEAQQVHAGSDLASDWWTLFHSKALDDFIAAALRDNATLASASASLREAQEVLAANRGNLQLPSANLQLGAEREQASGAQLGLETPPSTFSLYNAQVAVTYTLDAFGAVRRQLEGLRAQVDYQENQLRAAQLALSANIVTAVVREAQLRDQVEALRDVERLQRAGLEIVERRFAIGAVTRTDVLNQRSALASTVAAIPPLERQRAQMRHLLAVYAGKSPSEIDLSALDRSRLELPADLPASVPSDLVRQRPDVLAAESLLHAASAQVGVATANLYPQITLGASYGHESLAANQLFKPDTAAWGLSAGLLQPIFHGGALQAQRRAALAAFDAAAADYRQTVVTAFANVADSLRALELDAQALGAVTDAYQQARAAAELAQKQFEVGAVSYLSLLSAQQQLRQASVQVVQTRADRFADTAALFQAIGGGWWNPPSGGAANGGVPAPVAAD